MYLSSFDPSSSYSNLIAYDDETKGDLQFKFTMDLEADVNYILIVTTYHPSTIGSYTLTVSGLNRVNIKNNAIMKMVRR